MFVGSLTMCKKISATLVEENVVMRCLYGPIFCCFLGSLHIVISTCCVLSLHVLSHMGYFEVSMLFAVWGQVQ